ncbi:MAG: metal ABC transporter permease [Treponema sp.]|nr:metal ABC transporter permease [Treponema sp.]
MIENLVYYFQFSFVIYALIAGVMIALCSSLLGVTLVLKRLPFIGDGLSHAAFGALALASVLKIAVPTYFVLPVTILAAVLVMCGGKNSKIKGDASIAMISVGSLAFGYLLMNIFSPSSNLSGDVCTTLFGSTSILTLSKGDVILSVALSVGVVIFFILFYNRIFSITFDEDFARANGTNTRFYNIALSVIIAVIIVLSMNLVGSLLISALIIFPAISAMRIFSNFKSVTVFSALSSVACALVGIFISILAGTPVGSTIVAVDFIMFITCYIIGKVI